MLRVRKEAFLPLPIRAEHRAVLDTVQLCEEIRAECDTAKPADGVAAALALIEESNRRMEETMQGMRFNGGA